MSARKIFPISCSSSAIKQVGDDPTPPIMTQHDSKNEYLPAPQPKLLMDYQLPLVLPEEPCSIRK